MRDIEKFWRKWEYDPEGDYLKVTVGYDNGSSSSQTVKCLTAWHRESVLKSATDELILCRLASMFYCVYGLNGVGENIELFNKLVNQVSDWLNYKVKP